ncbi:MAG: hypothetical protein ACWGPS_09050 [Candidatus Promineifilaceae bacterium]
MADTNQLQVFPDPTSGGCNIASSLAVSPGLDNWCKIVGYLVPPADRPAPPGG